jgi:hypothetical protein
MRQCNILSRDFQAFHFLAIDLQEANIALILMQERDAFDQSKIFLLVAAMPRLPIHKPQLIGIRI